MTAAAAVPRSLMATGRALVAVVVAVPLLATTCFLLSRVPRPAVVLLLGRRPVFGLPVAVRPLVAAGLVGILLARVRAAAMEKASEMRVVEGKWREPR